MNRQVTSVATVAAMSVAVALAVSCAHTPTYKEFAAETCPVSFRYPDGWHQEIPSTDESEAVERNVACALVLDPPDWQRLQRRSEFVVDDHAMNIEVTRHTFAEAAEDAGLSRTAEGRWQIDLGRFGILWRNRSARVMPLACVGSSHIEPFERKVAASTGPGRLPSWSSVTERTRRNRRRSSRGCRCFGVHCAKPAVPHGRRQSRSPLMEPTRLASSG